VMPVPQLEPIAPGPKPAQPANAVAGTPWVRVSAAGDLAARFLDL
jgi:hypothetical protein